MLYKTMCFYGSEGMGLRADNLKVHVCIAHGIGALILAMTKLQMA